MAAACAAAPSAMAAPPSPTGPWDGRKPFPCDVQNVGTGTEFRDPKADPFCVRFDKTHQNITELGIVDFLLKEPARVAAAVNKCQYFQKDHWTGKIAEGKAGGELYNFKGRYYFDKSSGAGGVYVKELRVLGKPIDPTTFPGFPAAFKPYFSKGGGGARVDFELPDSPLCSAGAVTAAAVEDDYYGTTPIPPAGGTKKECPKVKGRVTRKGIGAARLGRKTGQIKRALGTPGKTAGDLYRYCTTESGGRLVIGFKGTTSAFVGTNVDGVTLEGVKVGDKTSKAKKKLKGAKERGTLLVLKDGKANLVLATKGKTIESVGVAGSKLSGKLLKKFANQSG